MPTPRAPRCATRGLWNIPYQRNTFFTGREEELDTLYLSLQSHDIVALVHPQGISGLGGIGKTQIALEYAYRYGAEYEAVCWVRADSIGALVSSFTELARMLELPERDEQNQNLIVKAVLRWFRLHERWLLLFDNIEDLQIVGPFLPADGRGHIIFTTRARALSGIAQCMEIQKMEPEDGALLLLRRAHILSPYAPLEQASVADRGIASQIVEELDGLPLALDQAGAYIKETPCSLHDYLALYQTRRADLLLARGSPGKDYPASVATTWSLSFEKVSKTDAAATELLDVLAFLAADTIPEKLLMEGSTSLGPVLTTALSDRLALNAAIGTLLAYSLVRRDTESATGSQILSIHRLVQTVLQDAMDVQRRRLWASRTVQAVGHTFPSTQFEAWRLCDLWLPHAQMCMTYITEDGIETLEAAQLLNQTGFYLQKRGRFAEAEGPLHLGLVMKERLLGTDHLEISGNLNLLAEFYRFQSRYEEAEHLHMRALHIRRQSLGELHPLVAESLNNLGFVYRAAGGYTRAEPLQRQALEIRKKTLGPEHRDVAISLDTMAGLFRAMGRYAEAEPYYQQALEIRRQVLGETHPHIALSLNNLAGYYRALEKYEEARRLYEQALELRKQTLGSAEHPDVALSLHGLAEIHTELGNYEEAEQLFEQALRIKEQKQGRDTWDVARMLNGKAILYVDMGRYQEAEHLYERSLSIWRKTPGIEIAEEEDSLKRLALGIWEKVLGLHTDVARSLERLALLYHMRGEEQESAPLLERALQMREQILGAQHPSTLRSQRLFTDLSRSQQQTEEAPPSFPRSQKTSAEQTLLTNDTTSGMGTHTM
jgi:tetratricopeptide (TPR) repeat protein